MFEQEPIWTFIYGKVFSIAARITKVNSCKLSGKECSCKIMGDGVQHHYGIDFPDHPPATLFISCNYLTETVAWSFHIDIDFIFAN